MGHISTLRVIFDLVPVVALMVTVDRNLWGDPRATLAVRSLLTQEEREAVRAAAGADPSEEDPGALCATFLRNHPPATC